MTRDELAAIVSERLNPALRDKSGGVMLSGPTTIAPGRFYVMGLNPGGNPATLTATIGQNLAPPDGASCYTDECWNKQCGDDPACEHLQDGRVRPEAYVRHQRNMISLAKMLGHATPASLPSANAIFGRSTSLATLMHQSGIDAGTWWRGCWPVHQALLEVVRPAAIITLGYGMNTSAFGFLARIAGSVAIEKIGVSRRDGKAFTCNLDLGESRLKTCVIGVPHPSYHASGDLLADELRAQAAAPATFAQL